MIVCTHCNAPFFTLNAYLAHAGAGRGDPDVQRINTFLNELTAGTVPDQDAILATRLAFERLVGHLYPWPEPVAQR